MKIKRMKQFLWAFALFAMLASCEDELELAPVDEFAPETTLTTEEGLQAALFGAYEQYNRRVRTRDEILINEVTTDIGLVRIGAVEREMRTFIDFNWDPTLNAFQNLFWAPPYRAIRNANTVLDNIDVFDGDADFKALTAAEARYIRAFEYVFLYKYYGLVPLRTTNDLTIQPGALGLPTEDEFRTFVETELAAAAQDLPDPSPQVEVTRATKGHAYATLVKFLMNTRQWAKAISATQDLMDLGYYELFPEYRATFFVENEPQNNPANREIIVTWSLANEASFQNNYQNGAFPPGFRRSDNIPEFEWIPGMANWATQFSMRDGFVDSFDPDDSRGQTIVRTYINADGVEVDLVAANTDNRRSIKYFDNNQIGNFSGADVPYIRYADILLSRAEALNEVNGPTQEAVDLINMVRERAGVATYSLADVGSADSFRDLILDERGWEFFSEGKRREDLIRHNKFLEFAEQRGLTTSPEQIYFPYPQAEVDANSALEQREGY